MLSEKIKILNIILFHSIRGKLNTAKYRRYTFRVRFPLEEIINLKFLIFRSGIKANRGIEFRHQTLNASRIRGKMKRVRDTRNPSPTQLQREAEKKIFLKINVH